jgi:CDP-glycerol glycerophosphotransferase (TagB/SpsB family)
MDELVYIMGNAMHWAVYAPVYKLIPETIVVAVTPDAAKFLSERQIPFRTEVGNPSVVVVCDHCYLWIAGLANLSSKKVNLFHGIAEKGYTHAAENSLFDLLLVPGEYSSERFRAQGITQVKVVGTPKMDPLFDGSLNKKEILCELGAEPERKTILYAPTWGEISSAPLLTETISELGGAYNVIVKLHQNSLPEWKKPYQNLENIYFHQDPDITPCMYAADVLISDGSSVIFEYASLNRPMVLFDYNLDKYDHNGVEYLWRDAGFRVSMPQEIPAAIKFCLTNPEHLQKKRQTYTARLYSGFDGKAAFRVAQELKALANLSEPDFR